MPKDTTQDALENLVDAWESLPGGRNYSPREVEAWMSKKLKPAFDRARRVLGRQIGDDQ